MATKRRTAAEEAQKQHFSIRNIQPLTENQDRAFQAYDEGKHLALTGSAGTGKSFLAMYLALKEIIKEEMANMENLAIAEEAPPDMFGEPDEEGGMARNELLKIAKYGQEIRDMREDEDQLPAWVQSKITKCAAMIGDVKHFLEGEMANQSDEMAPPQESDEEEVELGDEELEDESSLDEMIAEELKAIFEKKK